jgi:branched-subunit amino acid transport protein AzlD
MLAKVGSAAALVAVHALIYYASGILALQSAVAITACYAAMIHARSSKPSRVRTFGMYVPAITILVVLAAWTYRNLQSDSSSGGGMILVSLLMIFTASLLGHPVNLFPDKAGDEKTSRAGSGKHA